MPVRLRLWARVRLLRILFSLVFFFLVGVALFFIAFYLYLQTPQGKKKVLTLTLRALAELGDSEIQKISFQRPLTLKVQGLRLYDRQCQIWADLPMVQLRLRPWQVYKLLLAKLDLPVQSITLESPHVYLYHQRRDGVLNLTRVFPTSEDTTPSQWEWYLQLPSLSLHNGTFRFVDSTQTDSILLPTPPYMNYANLHFQNINLKASLHLEKETRILISDFSCNEIHSQTHFGPIRTYLIASEKNTPSIKIGPTQLQWNTSKAFIRGFFQREKLRDLFNDSPYKQFVAHFDSAEVDWRDIEVFSGPLRLRGRWRFEGTVEGDETYFATSNLRIRTETQATFTVQGEIRHYAIPEKLFIRAQLTAEGSFQDVDTIFQGGLGLPIKKELSLNQLRASFEGRLKDFVVKATHPTAEVTLRMRQLSSYQGRATLKNFSPASWWEKLPIDTISGYVELEGKGFSPNAMELKAKGNFSKIYLTQLRIDTIAFESTIQEGYLRATVDAHATKGTFKGNLQLSLDSVQHILFFGQVTDFYISDWLGLTENVQLTGTCALETWGTLEKIHGNATLFKGQIQVDTISYPLRRIYIQLFPPSGQGREIALWTPFADISLKGNFSLPWLVQFFSELGGQLTYRLGTSPLPTYTPDTLRNASIQIVFHNLEPLSFLWGGKLTIEDFQPTLLQLSETPQGKSFSLHSKPQRISWEKTQFRFVELHIAGSWHPSQPLRLQHSTFQADTFTQESFRADSVVLIWDSLIFLHFHAGSPANQILWLLEVQGQNLDTFALRWHPKSRMYLQGETWTFSENARLMRQKETLIAQELILFSQDQRIVLMTLPEGNYLRFERVAIAPWVALIQPIPQLYGVLDGYVRLDPKNPSFAMTLAKLVYKGVLYDSLRLQGSLTEKDYLDLSGSMHFQGRLVLSASGKYYLNNAKDPLRVALYSYRLPLTALMPFLSDYVSHIHGEFSFNPLFVYGTLTRPHFIGNAYFSQVRVFLPILQTEYGFDGVIAFRNDTIIFKKLNLYDYQKNPLTLNGALYLYTPKGLALDMSFEEVKNFTLMRTTAEQDLYFYGRVVLARGRGRIFGSLDTPTLQGEIVLDKSTDLVLPIGAFKKASDFPPYIRLKKTQKADEKPMLPTYTGLDVNINLLSEPQTHFRIIFDPRTKDQLSLEGNSNLLLKITPEGNYRLSGKFHIQQGEYLLSIQNLISKRFYIESGSEIIWTDDPLNAWLNVKGVYRLSASLSQLDTSLSQRVPVEIRLLLTGSLMNPQTELELSIPELTLQGSPSLAIFLQRLRSDEQEKNRQIFALLTLGTFLPPDRFVGASQTASSSKGTIGEMLFNQLSNLIGEGLSRNLSFSMQTTQFTDLRSQVRLTLSDRLWVERNGLIIGNAQQAPTLGNVTVKMRIYPSQVIRETQSIVFVEFFNRENFSFSGGQIQSSKYGLGLSWQKNFFPLRGKF